MNFTLILDDVSGNSFIENPHAPKEDPCMTFVQYMRSTEQDASLGLQSASEGATEENIAEKEGGKSFRLWLLKRRALNPNLQVVIINLHSEFL